MLNDLFASVGPAYLRIGVLAIAALPVSILFATYHRIAKLSSLCERARADIDVQLCLRHDMIPGLVETVAGFAQYEGRMVESLRSASAAAMRAPTPQEREYAEGEVSLRLGAILTTIETCPELKDSQDLRLLGREIADVESKISETRRRFDSAVAEYNAMRSHFPGVLIARLFRANARALFNVGPQREAVERAPAVRF